jgi:hypothetical protein
MTDGSKPNLLSSLRRYLIATAVLNLFWEIAHMPLYTLWETGTAQEIAFAAVHCTGGDLLIALTAITSALMLFGHERWPEQQFKPVFIVTLIIGILYTTFSEWLNIEIRQSWEYSEAMPVLPIIGIGLSPLLQWVVVPISAFYWSRRPIRAKQY